MVCGIPKYMVSLLSLLVIASFVVAFGPKVGCNYFLWRCNINRNDTNNGVLNINIILKFRLAKVGRNMLLGFIYCLCRLRYIVRWRIDGTYFDLVGFKMDVSNLWYVSHCN